MRALRYLPIYLACLALAALLWQRPFLLTFCYALFSAGLLLRHHSRADLIWFFVPCLMGPLGELTPVAFGAWTYSAPQFLIPIWLPLAWGIAGVFMRLTAEALLEPRTD